MVTDEQTTPIEAAPVADEEGESRFRRGLVHAREVSRGTWRQLVDDDLLIKAGSLSYTTLLAIVPLLAVSFYVFSLTGVFRVLEIKVRDMILETLLAKSVITVTRYLDEFMENMNAAAIGVIGFLFLVLTATWLFVELQGAVNRVWQVKARRRLRRFISFILLMTFGPLLLGATIYITSVFSGTAMGKIFAPLGALVPYAASLISLVVIYKLLPNIIVRWKAALSGAAVAALLYELSKFGFNFFMDWVYEGSITTRIYGTFAMIPVFLVFLFNAWIIFLLGVVISRQVQMRMNGGDGEGPGGVTGHEPREKKKISDAG